jgi:hypothetical protein
MLSSRFQFRSFLPGAILFACLALTGCGDFCIVGFSNNGVGGVNVTAGNTRPACSLSQARGAVTAVLVKSPVCASCMPPSRVEHLFVTLRSIQLRPTAGADPNPREWIELAPDLDSEPRQIDLMGDSAPEALVNNAIVPAGSYSEVRLQFLAASPMNATVLPVENACGDNQWNCFVLADGRIEPFRFPGDVPELVIPSGAAENDSLMVLPDAKIELRLSMEVHQATHFSSSEGWTAEAILDGRAQAFQ